MKLAILIIIIIDSDWFHIPFNIYVYFYPGNITDDFAKHYRTEWHNGSILPKRRMPEDQATDFVEKWKTGFGIYGEQGAGELIHNEFNPRIITYFRMQPSSRRLQAYYRRIHLESKAVNSKTNFAGKGNRCCSIVRNWTLANCSWLY